VIFCFTLRTYDIDFFYLWSEYSRNQTVRAQEKDILIIIDDVWPNLKKEQLMQLKWYEYIQLIPYQYFRLILGLIMLLLLLIITLIINPSSIINILETLMNKFL
jgi:hypothetical protein